MDENQIKLRINEIKPVLATLEWDYKKQQINPAKAVQYTELKKEYKELTNQLESIQDNESAKPE